MGIVTLAASAVILAGLVALHRRSLKAAERRGYAQGYDRAKAMRDTQVYAAGYREGKVEGRELERRELQLSYHKAFEAGWVAALAEEALDDAKIVVNGSGVTKAL